MNKKLFFKSIQEIYKKHLRNEIDKCLIIIEENVPFLRKDIWSVEPHLNLINNIEKYKEIKKELENFIDYPNYFESLIQELIDDRVE